MDSTSQQCTVQHYRQRTDDCFGGCTYRMAYQSNIREARKNNGKNPLITIDVGSYYWGDHYEDALIASCIEKTQYDILGLGYMDFVDGNSTLANYIRGISENISIVNTSSDPSYDPVLCRNRTNSNIADGCRDSTETYLPSDEIIRNNKNIYDNYAIKSIATTAAANQHNFAIFVAFHPTKATQIPTVQGVTPPNSVYQDYHLRLLGAIELATKEIKQKEALLGFQNSLDPPVIVMSDMSYTEVQVLTYSVKNVIIAFHDTSTESSFSLNAFNQTVIFSPPTFTGTHFLAFHVNFKPDGSISEYNYVKKQLTYSSVQPISTEISRFDVTLIKATEQIELDLDKIISYSTNQLKSNHGTRNPGERPNLNTAGCSNFDCGAGRMVIDTYRLMCLPLIETICDVSLINGGDLGTDVTIDSKITRREIQNLLPFHNPIVVAEYMGSDILEAISHGYGSLFNSSDPVGVFPQSNVLVAFNGKDSSSITERIVEVKLREDNDEPQHLKAIIDLFWEYMHQNELVNNSSTINNEFISRTEMEGDMIADKNSDMYSIFENLKTSSISSTTSRFAYVNSKTNETRYVKPVVDPIEFFTYLQQQNLTQESIINYKPSEERKQFIKSIKEKRKLSKSQEAKNDPLKAGLLNSFQSYTANLAERREKKKQRNLAKLLESKKELSTENTPSLTTSVLSLFDYFTYYSSILLSNEEEMQLQSQYYYDNVKIYKQSLSEAGDEVDSENDLPIIESNQVYTVSIPRFLYEGGDGYSSLKQPQKALIGSDETLALEVYIGLYTKQSPFLALSNETLEKCFENEIPWITSTEKDCFTIWTELTEDDLDKCATDIDVCQKYGQKYADFFGIPFEENCSECSGLGACVYRQCVCNSSTNSLFADIEVIYGDDCSSAIEVVSILALNRYVSIPLIIVAFSLTLLIAVLLIKHRNARIIKAVSPKLGLVMCLGAIVSIISIIFSLLEASKASCTAKFALESFGFLLLYCPLLFRVYRIHQIFNINLSGGRQVKIASDTKLLNYIVIIVVGLGLVLCTVFITSPFMSQMIELGSKSHAVLLSCSNKHKSIPYTFTYLLRVPFLLWGCYLAFKTRRVEANFNESTYISLSIYAYGVLIVIFTPLKSLLSSSYPEVGAIAESVTSLVSTAFTILIVYIPRFYHLYRHGDDLTQHESFLPSFSNMKSDTDFPLSTSNLGSVLSRVEFEEIGRDLSDFDDDAIIAYIRLLEGSLYDHGLPLPITVKTKKKKANPQKSSLSPTSSLLVADESVSVINNSEAISPSSDEQKPSMVNYFKNKRNGFSAVSTNEIDIASTPPPSTSILTPEDTLNNSVITTELSTAPIIDQKDQKRKKLFAKSNVYRKF